MPAKDISWKMYTCTLTTIGRTRHCRGNVACTVHRQPDRSRNRLARSPPEACPYHRSHVFGADGDVGAPFSVSEGDGIAKQKRRSLAESRETVDPVSIYLREISKTPLLSMEEEQELAFRIGEGVAAHRQFR